jgi:hypothetical protein
MVKSLQKIKNDIYIFLEVVIALMCKKPCLFCFSLRPDLCFVQIM